MFELIPFDCSRMVLLAEVSAKWINFGFLSLTSFDFCKSLIAVVRRIVTIIVPHIFTAYLIYILKCMFIIYSQNVCGIFAAYLICCLESCLPHIRRLLTQSIRRRPNLHVKSEHLANILRILTSHIRLCLPNNRRVFASCSQKLFAAVHFFL